MPILLHRWSCFTVPILVFALVLGGCSRSEVPGDRTAEGPAAASQGESANTRSGSQKTADGKEDREAVNVELMDEAGFDAMLERNRGRVLLVDFWAAWCISCLQQFPHTVELHDRLADRGLSVVTVSLDDPEQKAEVLEFLRRQGASTDNYISQYGGSDKSMEVFQIDTGIPHYKLYDRQGNLDRVFSAGQQNIDLEELDRAVEALVGP